MRYYFRVIPVESTFVIVRNSVLRSRKNTFFGAFAPHSVVLTIARGLRPLTTKQMVPSGPAAPQLTFGSTAPPQLLGVYFGSLFLGVFYSQKSSKTQTPNLGVFYSQKKRYGSTAARSRCGVLAAHRSSCGGTWVRARFAPGSTV